MYSECYAAKNYTNAKPFSQIKHLLAPQHLSTYRSFLITSSARYAKSRAGTASKLTSNRWIKHHARVRTLDPAQERLAQTIPSHLLHLHRMFPHPRLINDQILILLLPEHASRHEAREDKAFLVISMVGTAAMEARCQHEERITPFHLRVLAQVFVWRRFMTPKMAPRYESRSAVLPRRLLRRDEESHARVTRFVRWIHVNWFGDPLMDRVVPMKRLVCSSWCDAKYNGIGELWFANGPLLVLAFPEPVLEREELGCYGLVGGMHDDLRSICVGDVQEGVSAAGLGGEERAGPRSVLV